MIRYAFFDTETHDAEDPRLVQLAYRMWDDQELVGEAKELFKPAVPITLGAMSVHHIRNEDVEGCLEFGMSHAFIKCLHNDWHERILIAHNYKFDEAVMKNEGIKTGRGICTLKVTQHYFPDLEQYKLQYLRYLFKIDDAEFRDLPAHDALNDVLVLEKVFFHLLQHLASVHAADTVDELFDRMQTITENPLLLKRIMFGKHKGKEFEAIAKSDREYLQWLLSSLRQNPKPDPDLIYTVSFYAQQ